MEVTKIGLEQLKERIRSIYLYPPTTLNIEELTNWFKGAEHMYGCVQKVIAEFEEELSDD